MEAKITKGIQFASLVAIVCTMLEKMLGLLREVKIAEALGVTVESDAYNVAYLLVITLFGMFSSAYCNSLMPITTELYVKDRQRMKNLINQIVTFSVFAMLIIIAMVFIFPGFFVKLIAAGLNQETVFLAEKLIRISIWALIPLVANSAFAIILRIYDKNLWPTITELVFPIPILCALFFGIKELNVLIICLVSGYYARTALLLYGTHQVGFRTRIQFGKVDRKIKVFFLMMPPMLLSSGLLQINTIIDNQVASAFGIGSVTALSLASKVNGLVYTVFSTSLMQIVYAAMTKAYITSNVLEYKMIIKKQIRLILSFVIPGFIILYQYSDQVIEMLFVRGNFTVNNAATSGAILKGYAVGLIVFVLRDICIYILFNKKQ